MKNKHKHQSKIYSALAILALLGSLFTPITNTHALTLQETDAEKAQAAFVELLRRYEEWETFDYERNLSDNLEKMSDAHSGAYTYFSKDRGDMLSFYLSWAGSTSKQCSDGQWLTMKIDKGTVNTIEQNKNNLSQNEMFNLIKDSSSYNDTCVKDYVDKELEKIATAINNFENVHKEIMAIYPNDTELRDLRYDHNEHGHSAGWTGNQSASAFTEGPRSNMVYEMQYIRLLANEDIYYGPYYHYAEFAGWLVKIDPMVLDGIDMPLAPEMYNFWNLVQQVRSNEEFMKYHQINHLLLFGSTDNDSVKKFKELILSIDPNADLSGVPEITQNIPVLNNAPNLSEDQFEALYNIVEKLPKYWNYSSLSSTMDDFERNANGLTNPSDAILILDSDRAIEEKTNRLLKSLRYINEEDLAAQTVSLLKKTRDYAYNRTEPSPDIVSTVDGIEKGELSWDTEKKEYIYKMLQKYYPERTDIDTLTQDEAISLIKTMSKYSVLQEFVDLEQDLKEFGYLTDDNLLAAFDSLPEDELKEIYNRIYNIALRLDPSLVPQILVPDTGANDIHDTSVVEIAKNVTAALVTLSVITGGLYVAKLYLFSPLKRQKRSRK